MPARLLPALLALLLLLPPARADDAHDRRQLNVHGQAHRLIAPDVAEISLRLQARAPDSATALNAAGEQVRQLHKALRRLLKPEQIRSTDVQLRAVVKGTQRSWRRDSSEAMEMLATRQLTLQRITLDELPEVMNTLAKQQPAQINHVRTLIKDAEQIRDELMLLAIDDARSRAQRMAARLDMRLGLPISVQPQQHGPMPVYAATRSLKLAEADNAGAGLDSPGQQRLEARVQIVFELEAP